MKTVEGNLIQLAKEGEFDVIIQGCNCFHTMGAGIAAQIANQFPEAQEVDLSTGYGDKGKLGTFSKALIKRYKVPFYVINLYSQYSIASRLNPKPVDYEAIKKGFEKIRQDFPDARIAYPMLGAGLAGGNWARIQDIIDKALYGLNHTLVIYKP